LIVRIDWDDLASIFTTIGVIFLLIFATFVSGGFVLWAIRENILPLSPGEKKDASSNPKT